MKKVLLLKSNAYEKKQIYREPDYWKFNAAGVWQAR
jgi:hypothetical protein